MPTYTYLCRACSREFDELQSISDDLLTICPNCKEPSLVRIIAGGAGLVFKGSGIYLTDYKKKPNSGESITPAATKSESKPSGDSKKSEEKPTKS